MIEVSYRKSVFDKTEKYCVLSKKDDFVEIVEWTNGEGCDVTVSSGRGDQKISLTYGELDAIDYLRRSLSYVEAKEGSK